MLLAVLNKSGVEKAMDLGRANCSVRWGCVKGWVASSDNPNIMVKGRVELGYMVSTIEGTGKWPPCTPPNACREINVESNHIHTDLYVPCYYQGVRPEELEAKRWRCGFHGLETEDITTFFGEIIFLVTGVTRSIPGKWVWRVAGIVSVYRETPGLKLIFPSMLFKATL